MRIGIPIWLSDLRTSWWTSLDNPLIFWSVCVACFREASLVIDSRQSSVESYNSWAPVERQDEGSILVICRKLHLKDGLVADILAAHSARERCTASPLLNNNLLYFCGHAAIWCSFLIFRLQCSPCFGTAWPCFFMLQASYVPTSGLSLFGLNVFQWLGTEVTWDTWTC